MRTLTAKKLPVINLTKEMTAGALRSEIIEGLTSYPRYIDPKFFYDEGGAWLFQQITRLEEYYLSRTEKSILKTHATQIVREMPGNNIVEIASGDCTKISILFNASLSAGRKNLTYFPYEINAATIKEATSWIMKIFPYVEVQGVVADITSQFYAIPQVPNRLICFFGSTLGNFSPENTRQFLKNLGGMMHPGEQFLLGLDMVKNIHVMEKAYNDSHGMTAAFNKNVLLVINHLIDADFNPEDFEHLAFYNEPDSRIEMHLRAKKTITLHSPYLNSDSTINKGETIPTD
ncbi:MAG: L-histidine N(alpha)-methyltransferase, partial [Syntrophothermus sp.]